MSARSLDKLALMLQNRSRFTPTLTHAILRNKGSAAMGIYLGIDVGTSGTKTLAMRENGKIVSSATVEYPLSSPKPGWSEQDPDDWWQATIKSVEQVLKQGKLKPADVKGIGLSGQMHGSVFLDKKHEVVRPAILWNDQRTTAECAEIEQRAGGRQKS